MPLKAAVQKLEDVDEAQRSLYREHDLGDGKGKIFVLDTEASLGCGNEDVTGLKTTVGNLRGQLDDATKAVKKFEGIEDPAAAIAAIAKVKELGDLDPTKEADKIAEAKFEALKTDLVQKHNAELATRDARLTAYKGNLETLSIDAEIDKAVSGLIAEQKLELQDGANGDIRQLLRASIKHEFDDETGTIKVKVVDDKGVERIADSQGNPMGLKDAVAELPKSRGYLFKSTGAAGMDTRTQGATNDATGGKKFSQMGPGEKAKYIGEHGYEKFHQNVMAERDARQAERANAGSGGGGQAA